MKSKLKKFGTLLLAIAFSGEVAAQTKEASKDPNIDSNVREFLKGLNSAPGKPIEQLPPIEGRAVLSGLQSSVKVDISGIVVTDKTIVVDGQNIMLNIVKPANAKGTLPVFMFFHGGGWVLGDFPTHQRMVRDLVVESGAAAVFVNYTPSPEAHYPVAINQAYNATKWVAEHGKEIGVDGKRLAVAGNSVGGNMATVVAMMAKEKKGPTIKLQVLFWPVTDANFETESYNLFAKDRFLTKNLMMWMWDNYTTDPKQRKEAYASPLQASNGQLKGLPPALVQTAQNDILRDEGEAYARKLDEAGVKVTATRYNGMIHDWGLLNPISTVSGTKSALLQAASEIKKALK
ncbi:alpha/beta hydrolase [Flavobacterium sp. GT2N3]|uniref:alpha/beta hydrolase n=1 Tax=unclassified Flavobacterium TaxID=196869 RepID=UPI003AAAD11B